MGQSMDPQTVVLVLALNRVAIGSLLALIEQRMSPPGSPKGEHRSAQHAGVSISDSARLRGFAVGSVAFGLSYLLRLVQAPASSSPFGTGADAAMIFATLCFASGLRHFGGPPPLARRVVVTWVSALREADSALYGAKQGGCNRVQMA